MGDNPMGKDKICEAIQQRKMPVRDGKPRCTHHAPNKLIHGLGGMGIEQQPACAAYHAHNMDK
eukprot:642014-Pelagomonas_calceolata.AAC.3